MPAASRTARHSSSIRFAQGPSFPRSASQPLMCRRGFRVPHGAFPAVIGLELRAERRNAIMDRRELSAAPGRPVVLREMQSHIRAVDLHPLGDAIVLVGIVRVSGAGRRTHVPFGPAFGHPFGEHLAGPARLADAEGEDAGLEGVRHAGHRPISGLPSGA